MEAFENLGGNSNVVVAAPKYRVVANTAMGWKNANLRGEMTRLLRRAGVSGWPRLFHSMRASRQTELQRDFPPQVVCSWLGNLPRIVQQSYLMVTEDDFAKATGANKVMVEGGVNRWFGKGARQRVSQASVGWHVGGVSFDDFEVAVSFFRGD